MAGAMQGAFSAAHSLGRKLHEIGAIDSGHFMQHAG